MNWIKEHIKLVITMIVIICLVAIIVISSYNLGWISLPGRAVQSLSLIHI